jgi:hypothetical protein
MADLTTGGLTSSLSSSFSRNAIFQPSQQNTRTARSSVVQSAQGTNSTSLDTQSSDLSSPTFNGKTLNPRARRGTYLDITV